MDQAGWVKLQLVSKRKSAWGVPRFTNHSQRVCGARRLAGKESIKEFQPGPVRRHKPDREHEALAAVYGKYTEGFATPDLVESRELLEELAGVPDE